MASYTVIKSNQSIYTGSEGNPPYSIQGCDMSGLPEDFWALHWNGTNGHIEWVGRHSTSITSESEIESTLGVSTTALIERRTARKAEIENG